MAMFEIDETRTAQPLASIDGALLTTFLCGGIVNPFGPTLMTIVVVGDLRPGRSLPLFELILNPFHRSATKIGRCNLPETWFPARDMEPLINWPFGGCPSLVLPNRLLEREDAIAIHALWLARLPGANTIWNWIKTYPADARKRVNAEVDHAMKKYFPKALSNEPFPLDAPEDHVPLEPGEPGKFAEYVLSPEHTESELAALFAAWDHALTVQRAHGSGALLEGAMDGNTFKKWMHAIARSCHLGLPPSASGG